MTVAGNHGKERAEQTFLSCHLNPSPPVIPSLACLSPVQCQGPADFCPLSSIKAISVEVTRACRLTQENLHTDPHLNFISLALMAFADPQDRGDRTQLGLTCQRWAAQCPRSVDITHPHYGPEVYEHYLALSP